MSNQPKVFEFAKEVGLETLALMDKIREWKLPVKSHMAELTPDMQEEIRKRLAPSAEAPAAPAKKRAVKKPAAAPTPVPKPVRSSKAASKEAVAEAAPAKVAAPGAKRIIRRKAGEATEEPVVAAPEVAPLETVPAAIEAPAPAVPEPAAPTPVEIVATAPEPQVAAPAEAEPLGAPITPDAGTRESEAAASPSAETATSPAASAPQVRRMREVVMTPRGPSSGVRSEPMIPRTNIVGRMDLSRVQPQGGGPGRPGAAPGPGGFRGPRPAGGAAGRNLRTGFFVAPPPTAPLPEGDHDRDRRPLDDRFAKKKPTPKTPGEGVDVQFSAAEFRKREMVFQPKKKKDSLGREARQTQITTPAAHKRVVRVDNNITVADFASAMNVKAPQLIKVLMNNGIMANMNTVLDYETAALVAPEFSFEVTNVFRTVEETLDGKAFGNLEAAAVARTPVVTVMGHVDHGKTSLLDAIRNANVASGEAGGITQHIGAYRVSLPSGQNVTFLDTPGHEAFTAMRARGANATDVAIIVVAADDGVMPQTAEAVNHAKAAGVPIIVAINKMDRPNANPDRIKKQLTEFELVPEEWGGSTIFVPVSAIKREGIQELLEQVLVVAEMQDLKANPERSGTGLVIEAKLDKGRGPVATLLIKDGSISVGQWIVAGQAYGRVRNMIDDKGQVRQSAGPGEPIEILGLNQAPSAGDRFDVTADEDIAREAAARRQQIVAQEAAKGSGEKLSIEAIFSKVQQGDVKELPVVLKSDVAGSAEAIKGMFAKAGTSEVKIKLIHSAVGGISESDVLLASTAKGLVIGFNVRPDGAAQAMAKRTGIDIKLYTIVYELMDDLKKLMGGLLAPTIQEKQLGRAEVRNLFVVPKIGTIAGCSVLDGKVARNNRVRLVRDGRVIYTGGMASLKRFKDDVKEVAQGFECGIGIENYNDVKVGDIIEAFVEESIAREL